MISYLVSTNGLEGILPGVDAVKGKGELVQNFETHYSQAADCSHEGNDIGVAENHHSLSSLQRQSRQLDRGHNLRSTLCLLPYL